MKRKEEEGTKRENRMPNCGVYFCAISVSAGVLQILESRKHDLLGRTRIEQLNFEAAYL